MNTDEQPIFEQQVGSLCNACLQNYVGLTLLARYYLQAADALLDRAVDDTAKLDVYVYPAVFLYRHSVELALKELIWMSNSLLGMGKTFPKDHHLLKLWQVLKKNASVLMGSDFRLMKEQVRFIETFLQEITRHDPESDAFRYPFTRKMKRSHPNVSYVNVTALRKQFNSMHEHLGPIAYVVHNLYDALP